MKEKPVVGLFGFVYCAHHSPVQHSLERRESFGHLFRVMVFPSSPPLVPRRGDFCTVGVYNNVERDYLLVCPSGGQVDTLPATHTYLGAGQDSLKK